MRRQEVTLSSATSSNPLPVDYRAQVFNIGIGCAISSGAVLTYSIQYTFDDVYASGYDPSTGNWFTHSVLTGRTTNADSSITSPVTAVRLTVSAYTGGSVTAVFLQSSGQG